MILDLLEILKDEFGDVLKAAIGNEVAGFENIDISYQDAVYLLQNDKMEIDQILQQDDTVVFNISGSQILFTLNGTKALVRPLRAVPLHALDRFLVIHLHGGDVHSVFIGQRCD